MTDPSPSQTEPTEPAEGEQDAPAADPAASADAPPRWSDRQPEPAPWYLGRPGAPQAPKPNGAGHGNGAGPQQGPGPSQGTGSGPQGADGQQGSANGSGQQGDVPTWTGRLPERPTQGNQPGGHNGGQGSGQPPQGRQPGPGPQGGPGPYGSQQGGQSPWHDPNRYGPPQRPEQRRPEPTEPRTPLDLRTRWARGLALGATACMMIALWYMYTEITAFPTFLISAGASLVLGLGGLWLGVFAQRAAAKQKKRAPEAVSSIIWGSIAAFISLMMIAYSMVFYSQLNQYANCMRSATTIALQNSCRTTYQNSYGGQN